MISGLHGNAVIGEISIVLTTKMSFGEEKTEELINTLSPSTASFEASIRIGSETKSEVIAEEREGTSDTLLSELSKRMDIVNKSFNP